MSPDQGCAARSETGSKPDYRREAVPPARKENYTMAYSEQVDVPLLIIAGIGKAAIFFYRFIFLFQ